MPLKQQILNSLKIVLTEFAKIFTKGADDKTYMYITEGLARYAG